MSENKLDDLKSTLMVLGLGSSLAAAFVGLHILARDFVEESQERVRAELKRDAPAGCVIEEKVQSYDCSPDGLMICDRHIPRLVCTGAAEKSAVEDYLRMYVIDVVYE
ncbi:hypothetical protein HZB90_03040 [archaeon]|nr:hypothetical protein [archaeon]